MSKDYNIDDILSEVKRKREEEAAEAENSAAEAEAEPTAVLSDAEEPAAEEETEEVTEPEAPDAEPETAEDGEAEANAEPEAEEEAEAADAEGVNIMDVAEEEEAPAEPEENETSGEQPKKKSKMKKILLAVLFTLLAIVIAGGIFLAVKGYGWLETLEKNKENASVTMEEWQGMKNRPTVFDPIQETEATELSSLEDMVRTWYYNGAPCSTNKVINVLLIGEDTRGKEIIEDDTRADAAIIASVNTETKEIVLTSVLRDSWSYWETTPGDESTGHFGKLNESMSTGNLSVYINALERLYKVNIDGYAIVNFTSFEKIINTLYKNGIELELTDAEINEINNHQGRYGGVTIEKTFEGSKGKMRLNGKQALAYCRIRHIDTDNARADRQKTTLMTIYKDFKDSSTARKMKLIDKLVPYVSTSFSSNEIIKIATYAISHGWMGYEIRSFNYPEINVTGGIYRPQFRNQWIWRADFPADAYDMQTRIYGKSCITLAHIRVDTKTVGQSGFYKDGARATYDTYTNPAYGEFTTCVPYPEDEENEEKE